MSTLELVYLQNLSKNQKCLKFRTRNAWFGCFSAGTWNKYRNIWNDHPQIFLILKLSERKEIPKFGRKNFWFGYFKAEIWKKYWHIWDQHHRICLTEKFGGKTKNWVFLNKNILFGYIWNKSWNFTENQKRLNLESKMWYLSIFGRQF